MSIPRHWFLVPMLALASPALAAPLTSVLTPLGAEAREDQIVLLNDSFQDGGGQAFLQLGFVTGEKAGVWVQVPASVPLFKVDYFRVLMGSAREARDLQPETFQNVFFHMGIADARYATAVIPQDIVNAASVTPGPYWNDIPAQGEQGPLRCVRAGELIGAALEFTHDGAPSIYRDLDGLANVKYNSLMAIPGGWNFSVAYGLRGDWILRVVGHAAKPDEC